MNYANITRIIAYLLTFIGAFIGFLSFDKGKYTKGLREMMSIGIIPLSLLSGIRHIFFGGNIIKNQGFFEIEAGGTNLAIALAGIVAVTKKMDNNVLGMIFLIYAMYLFIGSIAWIIHKPKGNIILWILAFWSMVGLLIYYSYVGFTKEIDHDDEKIIN